MEAAATGQRSALSCWAAANRDCSQQLLDSIDIGEAACPVEASHVPCSCLDHYEFSRPNPDVGNSAAYVMLYTTRPCMCAE